MDNMPLISVVTVVRNDETNIEKTIESVLNQNYPSVEYIIIDGGSDDGTVDVVNKYANRLAYRVGEPDNGIYDAMNKGVEKAGGEWIHFLNSGDIYCDRDVLHNIFDSVSCDNDSTYEDLIYGDIVLKYPFGMVRMDCSPSGNDHSLVRHPCCFIRTSVMKKYKYDTRYKISADTCFFSTCKNNDHRFKYIPLCITVFDSFSGLSSNNKINSYIEDMEICNVKKNSPRWIIGYIKSYLFFNIQKISPVIYGRLACFIKKYRISAYEQNSR